MVNKLVDLSLGTRDLRALKSDMQRLLPGCHGSIALLPPWSVVDDLPHAVGDHVEGQGRSSQANGFVEHLGTIGGERGRRGELRGRRGGWRGGRAEW